MANVPAVHPSVAYEENLLDCDIVYLNEVLSRSWTPEEREGGLHIGTHVFKGSLPALITYFMCAGWLVEHEPKHSLLRVTPPDL